MPKKKAINVIIVDDDPVFLDGLKFLISEPDKFRVIDTCTNGTELINSQKLSDADLVLSDIEMPEMDGIEAAMRLNYFYPKLPMVALTMYKEKVFLREIIGAGYRGFVHKPEISKELFNVIDKVLNNKFSFPEELKV